MVLDGNKTIGQLLITFEYFGHRITGVRVEHNFLYGVILVNIGTHVTQARQDVQNKQDRCKHVADGSVRAAADVQKVHPLMCATLNSVIMRTECYPFVPWTYVHRKQSRCTVISGSVRLPGRATTVDDRHVISGPPAAVESFDRPVVRREPRRHCQE